MVKRAGCPVVVEKKIENDDGYCWQYHLSNLLMYLTTTNTTVPTDTALRMRHSLLVKMV